MGVFHNEKLEKTSSAMSPVSLSQYDPTEIVFQPRLGERTNSGSNPLPVHCWLPDETTMLSPNDLTRKSTQRVKNVCPPLEQPPQLMLTVSAPWVASAHEAALTMFTALLKLWKLAD